MKTRCARDERTLVTTITKRLAEDLAEFLTEAGVRTAWLHSELDAFERIDILNGLRTGETQCVVGVNLLREGLDLPEVSLVAIFDADKQGFLRSQTSLIQTIGRAARHISGQVVLYADMHSEAMMGAMGETSRRREYQLAFNIEHGITARTAHKVGSLGGSFSEQLAGRKAAEHGVAYRADGGDVKTVADVPELTARMVDAAENLRFEEAARLRDLIKAIESHGTANDAGNAPAKAKRGPKKGRARRR